MHEHSDNPSGHDLASMVAAAVIANRDEINASRLAHGESGRIEIHVNPAMCSVKLVLFVEDRRVA